MTHSNIISEAQKIDEQSISYEQALILSEKLSVSNEWLDSGNIVFTFADQSKLEFDCDDEIRGWKVLE